MSRYIVQLTTKPVEKEDYIAEFDLIEEPFVGTVAYYVDENVDRDEYLKIFKESFESIPLCEVNSEENTITFKEGFKEAHFTERLRRLKDAVENLTLDEFMVDGSAIYDIHQLIENKYEMYVYDDYCQLMSFDTFVRSMVVDTPYYIGGFLSYKV